MQVPDPTPAEVRARAHKGKVRRRSSNEEPTQSSKTRADRGLPSGLGPGSSSPQLLPAFTGANALPLPMPLPLPGTGFAHPWSPPQPQPAVASAPLPAMAYGLPALVPHGLPPLSGGAGLGGAQHSLPINVSHSTDASDADFLPPPSTFALPLPHSPPRHDPGVLDDFRAPRDNLLTIAEGEEGDEEEEDEDDIDDEEDEAMQMQQEEMGGLH